MVEAGETHRDREYLTALFFLGANEEPVGPSKLSDMMDISRAGVLQKNRRIEELGYGEYIQNKGILLNEDGVSSIMRDISKHHAIETFFRETLDMGPEEAFKESSKIENFLSPRLLERIREKFGDELDCECSNCIDPDVDVDHDGISECHWYRKRFSLFDSTE